MQQVGQGNYRARREIEGTLNNLEQAFPKQEWTHFWTKLTESLGDQREEFMRKLQENEGNMRMTLAQFRDKMEDEYPAISSAWETIQTKYDRVGQVLKTTTVSDAINWAKNKFQTTMGVNSVEIGDGSQLFDSARAFLISFYNQMNSGRTHHRVRRSEAQVNQALDEIEQKFPKAEWDAFWNKLTDTLGDKRTEFQTQLESNQGNMDLTLTQYQDQLEGQYPQLREKWDAVQTRYNDMTDKLKTVKLSDVVNWLKNTMQNAENQADGINTDDLWQKLRTFIVTYYGKITQETTNYW
jgi:predicted nuclease with TOPRIM domain